MFFRADLINCRGGFGPSIFRLIHAVFLKGLPHGDEVFGWHIGLGIVNGIEYVAAAGSQSIDIASDVVIDCLVPRGKMQDIRLLV